MTIMTRGMQKTADLTSNAELLTMPVDPPALQEGNHLTVASQTPEEPITSYADPLAAVPKDNHCPETASTKLPGPKTKRAKAAKVKPKGWKANKVVFPFSSVSFWMFVDTRTEPLL